MKRMILKLLSENSRLTNAEIAAVVGTNEGEVARLIAELECDGVIRGYRAIVDYETLDSDTVSAIIELKVTPEADGGFEDVAREIARHSEVESVYLMSGACDIIVIVNGKSFREVATFVAERLATMSAVTGTATQFIMRKYKDYGRLLFGDSEDGREAVIL